LFLHVITGFCSLAQGCTPRNYIDKEQLYAVKEFEKQNKPARAKPVIQQPTQATVALFHFILIGGARSSHKKYTSASMTSIVESKPEAAAFREPKQSAPLMNAVLKLQVGESSK
jgi:hypothetical protein